MKKSPLDNLMYITQIGLNIFTPIFLGMLLGSWLDKKFYTGYIFLAIFSITGILAGMKKIIDLGKKL